jgi:ATP-dependent phosphofructokinase / diphosphate-dependent phosphofructokinase
VLATRFGEAAVHLVDRGGFGRMVALHSDEIADVSIEEAVGRYRLIPKDSQMVRTARSIGIYFGDE